MHKCGSLICIMFSGNLTLSFLVLVMSVVTIGSHNFVCTSNLYPGELYKWDLCVFGVSSNYLCGMSARLIIQMKLLEGKLILSFHNRTLC